MTAYLYYVTWFFWFQFRTLLMKMWMICACIKLIILPLSKNHHILFGKISCLMTVIALHIYYIFLLTIFNRLEIAHLTVVRRAMYHSSAKLLTARLGFESVMTQWCNPLILQPKRSGGQSLIPNRVPPFKYLDKGLQA